MTGLTKAQVDAAMGYYGVRSRPFFCLHTDEEIRAMIMKHDGVKQAWRAECKDVVSYSVFENAIQRRKIDFGVLRYTRDKLQALSTTALEQMYRRLGTVREVAKALGVCYQTAHKEFHKRGIEVTKVPVKKGWTKEILDDLLNKKGLGYTAIARMYNASPNGVLYACRMFGVKRTRPSKWGAEGGKMGNAVRYGKINLQPPKVTKPVEIDDDAWETMTLSQREEVLRNQKRHK